jgi:hypothetical protein
METPINPKAWLVCEPRLSDLRLSRQHPPCGDVKRDRSAGRLEGLSNATGGSLGGGQLKRCISAKGPRVNQRRPKGVCTS